ncbi:MAG: hypothetical protein P8K68_02755 [Algibacter sp.]|uniref:hypothetical protein n=1 Tax=Algibacter sp. TaxID=1872428 RepID=UPI0026224C7B|nr:hypothetical protein [Algibacter sp.]MDG1728249.1 hypothetical protein [Algibacter sp.]MDG2177690.1 hypothetical protein [Algibacter sp.]
MKKILVLCLTLVFFASCSIDDDNTSFSFEVLAVESVDIPDAFMLGEVYPITVSYLRPSTCHAFKEFYYLKENNERTVAPITYVFDNNDCQTLEEDNLVEDTFNFQVTSNGSYIFKFWQGKDASGETQYLTIEVPVIE